MPKDPPHSPSTTAPRVSVGMPAYNSAKWIGAAIESILSQSFSDLELIVSDNASTDATVEICERFASADPRVRIVRQATNLGANRNYSYVLSAAKGTYFKWASSSDWCAPTFIEKCVAALERDSGAVLACPRTAVFDGAVERAQPRGPDLDLRSNDSGARLVELLSTPGLNNAFNGVIRREALARASELGVYTGADIILMCELVLMGKFLLCDEQLFFRRMEIETATTLKSSSEKERHLVPAARSPLKWQDWRFHWGLLRATRFAGFPGRNWRVAVIYVLRKMLWSRRRLAADVWQSIRTIAP
jgi:glycosyltransferase involved in cell wall biosynthesis